MAIYHPVNTLVFAGNASGIGLKFYSPGGSNLGAPDGNPTTSDQAISVATFADGELTAQVSYTGINPAQYIWDVDFSLLDTNPVQTSQDLEALAADELGNVYWMRKDGSSTQVNIYKMDATGAQSLVCTATISLSSNNYTRTLSVSPDGTVAYLGERDPGTSATAITKVTLSSGASSTFLSGTGGAGTIGVLVLGDNSVLVGWGNFSSQGTNIKRYDSSGTLLNTYASLPQNYYGTLGFARAYATTGAAGARATDSGRFFVSYFSDASGPGVTVAQISVSTGTAISSFDPPTDGAFDWGKMTALRFAIPTESTVPTTIPRIDKKCCSVDSTTPGVTNAGKLEDPLLGWTPSAVGGAVYAPAAAITLVERWDF